MDNETIKIIGLEAIQAKNYIDRLVSELKKDIEMDILKFEQIEKLRMKIGIATYLQDRTSRDITRYESIKSYEQQSLKNI